MPSSGMRRRVRLARTHVSEERVASIFRVKRTSELETLAVHMKLNHTVFLRSLFFSTLKMEATCSYEKSVITRPTRRNTPEDRIIHIHRCENLKSSM
jgi:hypothetical protein